MQLTLRRNRILIHGLFRISPAKKVDTECFVLKIFIFVLIGRAALKIHFSVNGFCLNFADLGLDLHMYAVILAIFFYRNHAENDDFSAIFFFD